MVTGSSEESSPKSNDLEGWLQAVRDDSLSGFRLESIAAAFQDLGTRDKVLQNALAKHLSRSILGILRRRTGFHHPNQGEDIMLRAHDEVILALLQPASADGRGLRSAFVPRVLFRLKDAIAKEDRERRIPDDAGQHAESKTNKKKRKNGTNQAVAVAFGSQDPCAERGDAIGFDDAVPWKPVTSTLSDEISDANEEIDVSRILECIPDERKRLAFRLFMDEVPYKSKRKEVTSIAGALGISEKTAREWIKEVTLILTRNEEVKSLKKLRAGESI
jgi:hypothetical protein